MVRITAIQQNGDYGPRMSSATVYNGVVYTSGVCGEDGGDVAKQTRDALAYLEKLLEDAGSSAERLLSMQVCVRTTSLQPLHFRCSRSVAVITIAVMNANWPLRFKIR